jgi:hypothetical protein
MSCNPCPASPWPPRCRLATLSAQAALDARPGGMVYDTVQNITWLQNWNTNGQVMDWTTANDWANNLVHGGFDDWRLPTSLNADGTGPCSSFNCTGSEMGHMFYNNWGATAGNAFSTGSNAANLALFTNVQFSDYWSGTEYAPNPGSAWRFGTVSLKFPHHQPEFPCSINHLRWISGLGF